MSQHEVFDPVVTVSPLPTLGTVTPTRPHTLTVYLPEAEDDSPDQGEVHVGRPPAFGPRLRRRYWQYEVDMSHHLTSVSLALPAEEEAVRFTARVALDWSVGDPVTVARLGVRDAKPIIWAFLDQLLRVVSRQYSIESSGPAEAEMNQRLTKESGELGYGLVLRFLSVDLRPDAMAEHHLTERMESRRAIDTAHDQHELRKLEESLRGKEAEARADLNRVAAAYTQDVDRIAAENARTIERLNVVHQIELKKVRMDFYRTAMTGGTYDLLVLQLIEHPTDINAVLQMLRAGKQEHFDWARTVMKDLLTEHMANTADMESLREQVITQLCSALTVAPQPSIVIEQSDKRLHKTAEGVEAQEKHTTIASIPTR